VLGSGSTRSQSRRVAESQSRRVAESQSRRRDSEGTGADNCGAEEERARFLRFLRLRCIVLSCVRRQKEELGLGFGCRSPQSRGERGRYTVLVCWLLIGSAVFDRLKRDRASLEVRLRVEPGKSGSGTSTHSL
jgi:hypothetical protein